MYFKHVLFEDTLFDECYFEDVTSTDTYFKNCTIESTIFYNTGKSMNRVDLLFEIVQLLSHKLYNVCAESWVLAPGRAQRSCRAKSFTLSVSQFDHM